MACQCSSELNQKILGTLGIALIHHPDCTVPAVEAAQERANAMTEEFNSMVRQTAQREATPLNSDALAQSIINMTGGTVVTNFDENE